MKRITALLLLAAVCVSMCSCGGSLVSTLKSYLGAADNKKPAGYIETVKTDEYEYDVYSDHVTLVEYLGNETEVLIPDTLGGKAVTVIGEYCFYENTVIETVAVPASVRSIETGAFYYCTSLRRVKLPSGCTSYGEKLFSWCTSLESVTIPAGMTVIPDYAFNNCTSLTEIIWGGNVTDIGVRSFSWCTSLVTLEIPEGVKAIGDYAFYNCGTLETVTLPGTPVTISDTAFEGCDKAAGIPSGTDESVPGVSSGISDTETSE